MSKFTDRLKMLRKEKDITLDALADELNITKATLSRYENDKRIPNIEYANRIASFFNVSVDYLMGKTDVKEAPKEINEVKDVEEAMQLILSQKGLMLNGTLLKDESKIAIANAIQAGIALAEKKQKEK